MARNSKELNKKKRLEELITAIGTLPDNKKPYMLALIHDFVEIEARCAELEKLPTFEIDPKNPKRQRKLPAHDMLKEWQQRKTETTRAIMRGLEGGDQEESPLLKILSQYETR